MCIRDSVMLWPIASVGTPTTCSRSTNALSWIIATRCHWIANAFPLIAIAGWLTRISRSINERSPILLVLWSWMLMRYRRTITAEMLTLCSRIMYGRLLITTAYSGATNGMLTLTITGAMLMRAVRISSRLSLIIARRLLWTRPISWPIAIGVRCIAC